MAISYTSYVHMRFSKLFTKTLREAPADEEAINAKLLTRGGFISKTMAGVYEYLPLGLRVLGKINAIIREEIEKTGAQELYLSVLQKKEIWQTTGRWESARDVMYQFKDSSGKEIGLGWTHEEPLTAIAKHFISSYKDLPKSVYQIQTKFRNEPRVKSGLLRGREFLMKDLYSFHANEEDLDSYYEKVASQYETIFKRCRLDARRTLASGGLFSKYSDEFQVIADVGEDTIFTCKQCRYSTNKEVAEEPKPKTGCPQCNGKMEKARGIEVGNIFKLGTKFSENFGLFYLDRNGQKKPVIMASYGIGPGRVMGAIVETHYDEKGIIWPKSVSPYNAHLVGLDLEDKKVKNACEELYKNLQNVNVEVLYDDREEATAGEKFADADLLGIPTRLLISAKTFVKQGVELKTRHLDNLEILKTNQVIDQIRSSIEDKSY